MFRGFKSQIELLKRKNSYREIEKIVIDYIFDKASEDLKSGTCLNNNLQIPFIKKRLGGSGGYRIYYLLKPKDKKLYLMFIHPKTGPYGSPNLTDEGKTEIYKEVANAIDKNNLYEVTCSENKSTLIFTKLKGNSIQKKNKP